MSLSVHDCDVGGRLGSGSQKFLSLMSDTIRSRRLQVLQSPWSNLIHPVSSSSYLFRKFSTLPVLSHPPHPPTTHHFILTSLFGIAGTIDRLRCFPAFCMEMLTQSWCHLKKNRLLMYAASIENLVCFFIFNASVPLFKNNRWFFCVKKKKVYHVSKMCWWMSDVGRLVCQG